VAFKIGIWNSLQTIFSGGWLSFWFYSLILSGVLPAIFGWCGIKVVDDRKELARICREQIELACQGEVAAAALPQELKLVPPAFEGKT
jgi:hypothetical protein